MTSRDRSIQNSNNQIPPFLSARGNKNKAIISNGENFTLGTENGSKFWNVLQYGVIGDGVTDDTTAIQAVIDGASGGSDSGGSIRGGDTVYFPPGTYLVDSITMKPGVTILGDGSKTSVMVARSNSTKIFTYTAASTQTYFNILNIGFYSDSKTSCYGIYLDGTDSGKRLSYVRINDVNVYGTFTSGIYLKYCANTFIRDAFMTNCTTGIYLNVCADTNIENCMVQLGSGNGYHILGGAGAFDEGVRLVGCSTNGQSRGLYIDGQDWGLVSGCSFTTCSNGGMSTANTCSFWKFTACDFATGVSPNYGINLTSGTTGFSFIGCTIGADTFGAIIRGTKHTFIGNFLTNNSNIDVYIDGGTNNTINSNVANSTGSGFSIYEVSPANYNIINGNLVNGTITVVGANSVSANNVTY